MNSGTARISVVVPAYNVERYVESALESLLNQTQPFHEIIVINDGSTDRTLEKLSRYAGEPRVTIKSTANQGLGPARQEGIGLATGDYIYFFDSDDLLQPDFVERISERILTEENPDLIFISSSVFHDDELNLLNADAAADDQYRRMVTGSFASGLDACKAMLDSGKLSPSACLYVSKRSLWRDGLKFPSIIHEDDYVIPRLFAAAGKSVVTDMCLYRRRIRNGSIMNGRGSRKHVDGYFQAFRSTWWVLRKTRDPEHKATLKRLLAGVVWLYFYECRRSELSPRPMEVLEMLCVNGSVPARDLARASLPSNLRTTLRTFRALVQGGQ
ncbi:Glycosyltransferase involved in cell wall bisynthesis [Noviherbaspirillum humi]|uniref:Glycosyltransferase involved in cell wall bisynthesis n=1 Tax=Noviherbaspirillum humi TaxID=1688639 RepID=A0A239GWL5_9BURK|nr:glycosyltransferase family 2 protein [Noviherbaspirillum humi]SNS73158.1 Glycosyltransferase involved in cell wall bisynthesis [Noviherbaspirillum humi]